jgi:outer membrane protein OmpA-like peptidoglycan-associated protein
MAMAAAPTPPATPAETMRPMPLAASPPPPAPVTAVSGGSGMLVADQGMPVGRAMTVDDLGTTVIGGDGAVSVEPYVPVAAASAADASAGDAYAPIGAGVSTLVATIQFAHGSAGLSANDRKILRQVADLQKRYGGTLRVVGHASSRTANMTLAEHQMANFSTSAARADQVTSALARLGTPAQAIQAVALSDNDPVYYEVMPSGEAGNRRAEIYLDY